MYNEDKYLYFTGAYVEKQYIYAVNGGPGALFRINRGTDEVELLRKLDGYQNTSSYFVRTVFEKDQHLFLFSGYSYEVAEYDLRTAEFHYYYPMERNIVFNMAGVIHRQGDNVWFFREFSEPLVACFSMEKREYEFFTLDVSLLLESCKDKVPVWVGFESDCYYDGKVWRVIPGTNVIYSIALSGLSIEIYELPLEEHLYIVSVYNGVFHLTTLNGKKIVCWEPAKGIISNIHIPNILSEERGYREYIRNGDRGILVPCMADYLICDFFADNQDAKISVRKLPDKLRKVHDAANWGWFINYYQEDNHVILFPYSSNAAIEICLETMELFLHQYIISPQDYMKITSGADGIFTEKEGWQLKEYINIVSEI